MPRYSKRRASRKITRWARKWGKRRRRRRLPPLGFPKSKKVRLRYVQTFSLDAPGSGIATRYFRANGMFDPDASVGGHQPLYFDQYMAGYDHYTVIGSKIKVTPSNASTADIVPVYYGVIIDDDSSNSYTNADQIIESNQGRTFKLAGPSNAPHRS